MLCSIRGFRYKKSIYADVMASCGTSTGVGSRGACYVKNDGHLPFVGTLNITSISFKTGAETVLRTQQLTLHMAGAAAEMSEGPDAWSCADLPEPISTEHTMSNGLAYTATAGLLPIVLKEEDGVAGSIFFAAYTCPQLEGAAPRPVTFLFNGGPGSSSVWLHLGGIGPQRVELLPDGGQPAPPYSLVESEACWLPFTDIVFIDAMGAGFSRRRCKYISYHKAIVGRLNNQI